MISETQYQNFIKNVTESLEKDWVIVGGSLLALIKASTRATSDIDICPLNDMSNEDRLALMDLAIKSNLPIEAINPSADFFLRQIPCWKSSLVLLINGKKGKIYRPSLELYIQLKLNRASQIDIEDCISFIKWHKLENIAYDSEKIKEHLNNYSPSLRSKIQSFL